MSFYLENITKMLTRYITQVFRHVDIDEIVEMGTSLCNIYEGSVDREKFETSPTF